MTWVPVPNGFSSGVFASQILEVLGADGFAEFAAIRTPGTMIWWNFELARQLRFQTPQTNEERAEFQAHLVSTLSLRAIVNGEVQNNERVTIFADKYGGDGVAPALGAGRAGAHRKRGQIGGFVFAIPDQQELLTMLKGGRE